jgi:divalent metal cation (Fe/Co/Zn/Cd) transporter
VRVESRARVAAACKNASVSVRADTAKLGERLQYATMAWNSAECIVALAAGFVAGSIALVGFGFDSAIEVTSSVAALWRLRSDRDEAAREAAERRTLRIIGVCFLVLAVYVAYGAARDLLLRQPPEHSLPGIVIAALSLIVMPLLVRAKRRVAAVLESGALEAEARQTRVCAFLSAILLFGLGANAALGWWWADPIAALAMVPVIAWEGWQALSGKTCCDH